AASALNVTEDISPAIVVNSTTTDRLQLVVPGHTAVPGLVVGGARGLSGTPDTAVAGQDYVVTANITDRFYNVNTDVNTQVMLQTTDSYDIHPATLSITAGSTDYTVIFHTTPGPWTITASTTPIHITPPLQDFVSDDINVTPGPAVMFQVLMPGETAVPGKPPYDSGEEGGKTGLPDGDLIAVGTQPFVAGSTFSLTVNLVDQFFNRSLTENTFVELTASDPYDSVAALGQKQTGADGNPTGQTVFDNVALVTRNTAPGWQISASTATGDSYLVGRSTWIPVQAGSVQRLLVLAPGEVSEEGNPIGKSDDIPDSQVSGSTFTIEIRAVDDHFNIVPGTNPFVNLTFVGNTNSAYDDVFAEPTKPAGKNLTTGTTDFDLFLVTGENKNTIIIATATGLQDGFSGVIQMNPGPTTKFQLVFPGQTTDPGNYLNGARGLLGVPDRDDNNGNGQDSFIAGTPFDVTVRAVDNYWNQTTATPIGMELVSTDPDDLGDPMAISLNAGATTVSWTFNTSNESQGWTLTIDDGGAGFDAFVSTWLPTEPGAPTKLQVLLPGEDADPGSTTGKTGTPTDWTAGNITTVTVNVVDSNWNIVPTASLSVQLTNNSDSFSSPITQPLINGTTIFNFLVYTASASSDFTAQRTSGLVIPQPTAISASMTINPNVASRIQAYLPGETTVPGQPPYDGTGGRTGYPDYDSNSGNGQTPFPAGVLFPVTVQATDNYYNPVQPNAKVQLTTEDPYDTHPGPQSLSAGTTIFNIFMHTENTTPGWTIQVGSTSDSATTLSANVTPAVPVSAGAKAKLQVLLPGETPVPGYTIGGAKGKTGPPNPAVAGQSYNIQVRMTDAFYNLVTGGSMPTVQLTSTDPWDDESAYSGGNPQSLDPGTGIATFGVYFNTSSSWTVTASDDPYTNLYDNDTSTDIFVQPAAADRLLVLLPGETFTPGKLTPPLGRTGTPYVQTVGENISIDVVVTDAFYNKVSTSQNPIQVITNDPYDSNPGNFTLFQGSVTISTVSLRLAQSGVIITATDLDPPYLSLGNSTSFQAAPSTAARIQVI
ncbi:hypothetical protein BVX98_07640, partial [bacterium F11]